MLIIDTVEGLMNFGLTRQEANVYLLLFSEGHLNGYEVSKLSGISRSNAYNALAGLVEKGAAYVIEGNSVSYTPVDINEFCDNKIRLLQKNKNELINNMPKKRVESDGYITIKGEKHILDKMKNMILEANERIYLSMSHKWLKEVINELNIIKNKGIKIVIITEESFFLENAKVFYTEKKTEQIRMIVDSKHVLTGSILDPNYSTCLYSSNNNLVEVFKEALKNEIVLIEINKGDKK